MAVLTINNVIPISIRGDANLVGYFALRNVTTADTIDLASLGVSPSFQVIKSGVVLGESDFVEIAATFAGTTVTMPAGLNKSSGYLLVIGS